VRYNRYTLPSETADECKSLGMDADEIFKYETYWLKKAYIDHDPADGAPKVGKIGYV